MLRKTVAAALFQLGAATALAQTVSIDFAGEMVSTINMPTTTFSGRIVYDVARATSTSYSATFGEASSRSGCLLTVDGNCYLHYGSAPSMVSIEATIDEVSYGVNYSQQHQESTLQLNGGFASYWGAFSSSDTTTVTGDYAGGNYSYHRDFASFAVVLSATNIWEMFPDGMSIQAPDPLDFAHANRRDFSFSTWSETCTFVSGTCTNLQQIGVRQYNGFLTSFAVSVPEPPSALLILVGAIGVATLIRRTSKGGSDAA
jgi:hypothetical protein